MDCFQKIREWRDFSKSFGYTLVETILVLTISSILMLIVIPKLEVPVKKSFKTIKTYSQNGFSSLKNSGYLLEEYRLIQEKISTKSYLVAAKDMYMSESNLPSTVADLSRFTPVVGCYLPANQSPIKYSKDCIPLSNKLNISSWESKNRLFKIEMISSKSKLNILSIPYNKNNKGVNGCYDSKTGIIKINIFEGEFLDKRLYDC